MATADMLVEYGFVLVSLIFSVSNVFRKTVTTFLLSWNIHLNSISFSSSLTLPSTYITWGRLRDGHSERVIHARSCCMVVSERGLQ